MRVLMLATTVPARVGDGTPSFVLDTAQALASDHQVQIVAPRVRASLRRTRIDGVEVIRFPYFFHRWERLADEAIVPQLRRHRLLWLQAIALSISLMASALRSAVRLRPDVIHAHWIVPSGLVAIGLKRLLRVPVVITAHGSDVFTMNSRLMLTTKRIIAGKADALVLSSEAMSDRLAVDTPRIQPAGVDTEFWRTAVGARQPVIGRLLFVGRLAENKGAHVAIDALTYNTTVHLRVVGGGPELDRLTRFAEERGVGSRVAFVGHASRDQVVDELRRAMCLVIPSQEGTDGAQEGTPSVLGEAAAAGVPIIASRLSGLAEIIEHQQTGLLVEPGDTASLASAVRLLLDDAKLRLQLSHRASTELAPKLSVTRSADTYRDVYRSVSSGSAPPRLRMQAEE